MVNIRWGILGTGNIAGQFARGLRALPDATLAAVGSRTQASADRFAAEFGAARSHGSYEELAHNPDIDAVYVATPHPLHADNARICLEAGKAVLCEKPFTVNSIEARSIIELARREQRFLMEAMWTRFLPAFVRLRELLAAGKIGEPRLVQADFGFRTNVNPAGRLFALELGGGALLDVGIYPISFASMVFGPPKDVTSLTHIGETGVDEQAAVLLNYSAGQIASLTAAIRTNTPQVATIMGTGGMIQISSPWWKATQLRVMLPNAEPQVLELPFVGNGYNYEAAEVMRCLRAGQLESPTMPLDETLNLMETLDRLRAQWGLRYPME